MLIRSILRFFGILMLMQAGYLSAQVTLPVPQMDQGLIPPSPNASAFATYGVIPVALYSGIPNVSIPIYNLKVGSLSLPITLNYNYNGLRPKQDASWVGLGWNLNAGGSITRVIQSQVDGTRSSGFNYGEYSLKDSVNANSATFQHNAYDLSEYDLAPDIFIFNFPGHTGKFAYYQGAGYTFPYQKLKIFKAPIDSYISITDEMGTLYTFSDVEVTTTKQVKPTDPYIAPYKSTWYLSQMVSANKKDTINFTYTGGYTAKEYGPPYGQVDWHYNSGTMLTTNVDSVSNEFDISPSVTAKVLSSITCNHTTITFTAANTRLDVSGNNYPSLSSITLTDNITGNLIKQCSFYYEYFVNNLNPNASNYMRLKLKQFTETATSGSETHSHTFCYNNEYGGTFPNKGTLGIDYWGYYNGYDANLYLIPNTILANGGIRKPDFTHAIYGALDTIKYPTGGYTAFLYDSNSLGTSAGPGIRVKTITSYSDSSGIPSITKSYTYTGGSLFFGNTASSSYGYTATYFANGTINTSNYTVNSSGLGSSFGGIIDNTFYYTNVTEMASAGNEQHRTDNVFNSYVNYLTGIDQVQKTVYLSLGAGNFIPINNQSSTVNFQTTPGQSFETLTLTLTATNTIYPAPPETFNSSTNTLSSAWKYLSQQQQTYTDSLGNSSSTTANYYYNPTTINLQEVSMDNSDGTTSLTKFKYPEDYTSSITGSLVTAHVLAPVIEQQVWQKNSSTDSVIVGGKILAIDSTLFRPTDEYSLEISAPMHTLSNETQTGGLYNTLVSDVNYVDRVQKQYDGNANLIQENLSSNSKESYIWAYDHSLPIAKAENAPATQIAYTSFETPDKGNWSYSGATSSGGKTGDYQYSLSGGNITSPTLPSGSYIVSYWSNGSSATISGASSLTTNVNGQADGTGWTYYEYLATLTTSGSFTISGSIGIDEVRLYPSAAQMSTYTYHPSIGMTSQCSPAGRITYYQYDGFNRLQIVKDQQKNIVKTIQYNYVPQIQLNLN